MKELVKMVISRVLYIGYKLDVASVQALMRELGFSEEDVLSVKKELHMTVRFRPSREQIAKAKLGVRVGLRIVAWGEYREDGVLKNVGFKVEDSSGLSANQIAHVTLYTRNGGKAKDTGKCTFNHPLDLVVEGRLAVFDAANNWSFALDSSSR